MLSSCDVIIPRKAAQKLTGSHSQGEFPPNNVPAVLWFRRRMENNLAELVSISTGGIVNTQTSLSDVACKISSAQRG